MHATLRLYAVEAVSADEFALIETLAVAEAMTNFDMPVPVVPPTAEKTQTGAEP